MLTRGRAVGDDNIAGRISAKGHVWLGVVKMYFLTGELQQ